MTNYLLSEKHQGPLGQYNISLLEQNNNKLINDINELDNDLDNDFIYIIQDNNNNNLDTINNKLLEYEKILYIIQEQNKNYIDHKYNLLEKENKEIKIKLYNLEQENLKKDNIFNELKNGFINNKNKLNIIIENIKNNYNDFTQDLIKNKLNFLEKENINNINKLNIIMQNINIC
jgi:hypothetical protein